MLIYRLHLQVVYQFANDIETELKYDRIFVSVLSYL